MMIGGGIVLVKDPSGYTNGMGKNINDNSNSQTLLQKSKHQCKYFLSEKLSQGWQTAESEGLH